MPLLADLGTLSYNGYQFDGASQVTVHINYLQDDAQRTIVDQEHHIRVKSLVSNSQGTNSDMLYIRQRLGVQGAQLIFVQKGFGNDLIINAGGPARDSRFGPTPKVLSWEPIGGTNTCEIEWEVVVTIAICPDRRTVGIRSVNYTVDFSIDDRGYTTRTISGHLTIAMTRNGRFVPDVADAYWEQIAPTIPEGFTRQTSRTVSLDKARLDFTITDTQIPSPNAYPPGVVRIEASHRVGWSLTKAGWLRNSISATIEMAPNWPTDHAFLIFAAIVKLRTDIAKRQSQKNEQNIFFDELSVTEELFSRVVTAQVSYRVTEPLAVILKASGLWTPIGTNWRNWHLSMGVAHGHRGQAGLRQLPGNDAIIDLCGGGVTTIPWNFQNTPSQNQPSKQLPSLKNRKPTPEQSWFDYQSGLKVRRTQSTSRQRVLQQPESDTHISDQSTEGMVYPQRGNSTSDIIQRGTRSSYEITLKGHALRAGYQIPRPRLLSIGGVDVTEIVGEFEEALMANMLGVPIYAAKWAIDYALPNSPQTVAQLPNLEAHLDGNGNPN